MATRRGARSILGSLSTYAKASLILVAVLAGLAVVWWVGQDGPGAGVAVQLPADSTWSEVSLDNGQQLYVLEPGGRADVRPGRYRATFVPRAGDGAIERRELEIVAPLADLAAAGG